MGAIKTRPYDKSSLGRAPMRFHQGNCGGAHHSAAWAHQCMGPGTQRARGPGTARTLATRVQSLPAVQLAPPNNQGESLLARGAMGLGLALPPPIVCLGPGAARQAGWGWGATVGAWGCKQIHPGQPDSRLNYFLTCRGNRIDQINSGRIFYVRRFYGPRLRH